MKIICKINANRSARVGDEIGGHNVSGHVCTTAAITNIHDTDNNRRITFEVPLNNSVLMQMMIRMPINW